MTWRKFNMVQTYCPILYSRNSPFVLFIFFQLSTPVPRATPGLKKCQLAHAPSKTEKTYIRKKNYQAITTKLTSDNKRNNKRKYWAM